ncbi:type I restriction-modification system subunit M N-terminal domain-containing protein [Akkermansia sp. RCC_12PD]|nr:type I restriction-modification system subunit M N-terminal domain-containing protein [Akkermansia sp.]MBS6781192.1 type I restriction-modification system subunit M N-terminal domain-containing protein [Akkermansia sp.]
MSKAIKQHGEYPYPSGTRYEQAITRCKNWESVNKRQSKIEANEYKDYILGFIFYKLLSDKEVKHLKENDWTDEYLSDLKEEDSETVESVRKNIGYFIPYDHLFSTWIAKASDFSADHVMTALLAFNRLINPSHKNIFSGFLPRWRLVYPSRGTLPARVPRPFET